MKAGIMRLPQEWTEGLRFRVGLLRRYMDFDRAMREAVGADDVRSALPAARIERLAEGWGDDSIGAPGDMTTTLLAEAQKAAGPTLQCGSGLSTLMLAILAHHSGKQLWVLEHDRHWANVLRSYVKAYEIQNTFIFSPAAKQSADYPWYAIDAGRLPGKFSLVICQGHDFTPAGYRGVLSELGDRVDERGVILIRNLRRRQDVDAVSQWAKARRAVFVVRGKNEPFAKVALRSEAQAIEGLPVG